MFDQLNLYFAQQRPERVWPHGPFQESLESLGVPQFERLDYQLQITNHLWNLGNVCKYVSLWLSCSSHYLFDSFPATLNHLRPEEISSPNQPPLKKTATSSKPFARPAWVLVDINDNIAVAMPHRGYLPSEVGVVWCDSRCHSQGPWMKNDQRKRWGWIYSRKLCPAQLS